MRKQTVLAAALGAGLSLGCLAGCGDDDKEKDRHNGVKYSTAGGAVHCENICDSSEFTSGDYHTFTCIWCCNDYKGRNDVYVSITFRDTAGGWEIENEYISGGICTKAAPGTTEP